MRFANLCSIFVKENALISEIQSCLVSALQVSQDNNKNVLLNVIKTPAHYSLPVREHLKQIYHERVIGRSASNAWTPRSPDLTECDFFCGVT